MLAVSTRLGPYEILSPLGAGGMGEVYRARDSRLGREVAVKILPEESSNPDRKARFEREARAVAALSHPNILSIHDFGTEGTITYAVTELLEGETLRARLVKEPMTWQEAVEIGAAIADGLAAAHAKGIIHRDLKPENLFLTTDGRIKILDFGLARVILAADSQSETGSYVPAETDPGRVMGTAGYMSPEQVRGQTVDARSDIFSFGCVLYEMLTGRRAFQRETAAETMTAILHDEPPEPTTSGHLFPAELGRLIRQCLAKTPSQRLQSARDLALGLRATASDPNLHRPPLARRSFPLSLELIAVLLIIGLIAAAAYFLNRGDKTQEANSSPSEASRTIDSLAILPLVNVTGDPKAEPLCDTMAEEVSSSLAQIRDRKIKVRPITSTIHYKGKHVDVRTAGNELDVQALITGRLRMDGNNLAIRLELIDARADDILWASKEYRGRLDEIMILQDQVAQDVAVNLGLRLSRDEEKHLTRRYTKDPGAYLLFREGRYYWDKGTPESMDLAIQRFQAAIDKDPNFALAYAWQAYAYIVLRRFRATEENRTRAKESAAQALLLDENLPEGHAALGAARFFLDLDWRQAQSELRQALALDPKSSHRCHYGYTLAVTGNLKEAITEIEQSVKDDPRYILANTALARVYLWDKRYEAALGQARKAVEISPGLLHAQAILGMAYVQLRQYDEALATFQDALKLSKGDPPTLGLLAYTYGLTGNRLEAERVLKLLQQLSPSHPFRAYGMAAAYTGLGDKDQAFHWLNESLDNHEGWMMFLKVDPQWESLRNDPRFDDLLRRLGLAEKAAATDQVIHSVAVLPFQNIGGDPKTEFLSDGVADQIINSLSQVRRKDLKVRPFTSVARYRGKEPDVPKFGRELNVRMIVTGTLRKQGDDLTISVALVDVKDENQLWGYSYPGKLSTILDLQDRIARDVAEHLRLQLTGDEEKRLTKRYTENPEAYQLYLKGRYFWNKRTEENIKKGIEYFKQAIEKDGAYALAYVGLADSYIQLANYGFAPPKEAMPKAKESALKALQIDERLAEAYTTLAWNNERYDWNISEAEKNFKRALELNPNYFTAYLWYAFYLGDRQRFDDSLTASRRAQELDPLSPMASATVGWALYFARRYDQAIEQLKKTLEIDPHFWVAHDYLARAYFQKGMYEEARAAFQKAKTLSPATPVLIAELGYTEAVSGRKREAQVALEELKELSKRQYVPSFWFAFLYSGLGEKDRAFEWVEKAYEERSSVFCYLEAEPMFDGIRSDSRVVDLLRLIGIAEKPAEGRTSR